jgi:RNA polymerase sigma factor (sigma-70 family)
MSEHDWLAERFQEQRPRLRAVAYRMLGSVSEADDAVQDAWLRVSRAGAGDVQNLGGWLTTIVARVCLNVLDSRRARREEPAGTQPPEPANGYNIAGPEDEALLADSVGVALLVVLDTLTPAERLAFVLHDLFDVSFGEIASIIGRSPDAVRQLASRARRRVRGAGTAQGPGLRRQREVVAAFLAASRSGDFQALLGVLDPGVVLRADQAAARLGATGRLDGADAVARTFAGRARAAQLALVDGVPGAVWMYRGKPRAVFTFTVTGGKITAIALAGDPDQIEATDLVLLGSPGATHSRP